MWLLNNLAFNAIWFAAIFFQNLALPFGVFFIALHCWYFNQQREIFVVIYVLLIGIFVDTLLMQLGVFIFEGQQYTIPFWLMLIWAAFGATINHSLAFLKKNKQLAFIVGAIFPPLSYFAGEKFGVVTFGYSTTSTTLLLAIIWAPLLYHLTQVSYEKKYFADA
ncbi:DUF2878 domain-containing protein [Thalassotalea eurytherma]|uniref:DUF2878 domain-containing protein n=1 Tax=Thalassotalea eurytherma TaxID=1144278 RepID=A0ABQ6H3Q6_9GAMM|nr:DUF2878 domain-containing protein [Thalassotalea eurytherma]GLX81385.1 hypothetical protein theurythT_08370 [Thalassotalea eurytherma]